MKNDKIRRNALSITLKSCLTVMVIPIFWIIFNSGIFTSDGTQSRNTPNLPSPWPPIVGEKYPDLYLIDQDGLPFRLSYLKGKVIIIEPIGMNYPACQAFSGGNIYGAYENNAVAQYTQSFKELFPRHTKGLRFPRKDIVFVQILLYDMKMEQPTTEDAAKWAKHFRMRKDDNHFVAVSPYDLRGKESYNLIPGFQLIDKDFILRSDSSGHNPKNDLYRHLLPMVPTLVK